jgi:hypothetical protein
MRSDRVREYIEKFTIRKITTSISDDTTILWELFSECKGEECRIDLELGEISRGSEYSEEGRQRRGKINK